MVQAHSQGSFLLVNPSIPTLSHSCCVRKFNSILTVLLEFESKEICMLTDKNLFTFISEKHSQHDARKCADRLNSDRKF